MDLGQIDVGEQDLLGAQARSRDHPPIRCTDKGLPRKDQALFLADAVAQGREIPVLKGCDPKFGLIQPVRPLPHRTSLGYDHHVSAAQSEGAHLFGVVPVIADRDPDPSGSGVEDRGAGVPGSVVALLMEALIVGDVDHPRSTQQGSISVNDG